MFAGDSLKASRTNQGSIGARSSPAGCFAGWISTLLSLGRCTWKLRWIEPARNLAGPWVTETNWSAQAETASIQILF